VVNMKLRVLIGSYNFWKEHAATCSFVGSYQCLKEHVAMSCNLVGSC